MHPQIPPNSKHFHRFPINGQDAGWQFGVPGHSGTYAVLSDWKCNASIDRNPEMRPLIAAVAVMEWEREAERLRVLAEYINEMLNAPNIDYRIGGFATVSRFINDTFREVTMQREMAMKNARDWRSWGGWA